MNTQLEFTKEIEKNTAGIYQKIKSVVPALEWPLHAPYIYKINELKNMKLGFIGVGKIATSVVEGIFKAGSKDDVLKIINSFKNDPAVESCSEGVLTGDYLAKDFLIFLED